MDKGFFTISLDFELHWGVLPRLSVQDYEVNLKGTQESINSTLKLFTNYEIHATWATVGFLFFDNKNALKNVLPNLKPTYKNSSYNPFPIIETIGDTEKEAPYHLAPSLIDKIGQTPFQEIGTHTFSHFYCLEEGQTVQAFQEDLQTAINIAKWRGIIIKSIVFPRNQYNAEYLATCGVLGITNVRGNPTHFIYQPRKREDERFYIRLFRLLDAYLNIAGHQIFQVKKQNGICDIPASRFLRPYSSKLRYLDGLRLRRIKREMTQAAIQKKLYHLWWHPHNFGAYTEENMIFLKKILDHFRFLQKHYDFSSLNMAEIGERFNSK